MTNENIPEWNDTKIIVKYSKTYMLSKILELSGLAFAGASLYSGNPRLAGGCLVAAFVGAVVDCFPTLYQNQIFEGRINVLNQKISALESQVNSSMEKK